MWLGARVVVVLICNTAAAAAAAAAAQSLTSNAAQMIATTSSCGCGSIMMWQIEVAWCFVNSTSLTLSFTADLGQELPTSHDPVVDRFVVLSLRQTRHSDASETNETTPDVTEIRLHHHCLWEASMTGGSTQTDRVRHSESRWDRPTAVSATAGVSHRSSKLVNSTAEAQSSALMISDERRQTAEHHPPGTVPAPPDDVIVCLCL